MGFLLPIALLTSIFDGVRWGGVFVLSTVAWVLLIVPSLDLLAPRDRSGKRRAPLWLFDLMLLAYVVCQAFTLNWGLSYVSAVDVSMTRQFAMMLSQAVVIGSIGMAAAHELIHRRSRLLRGVGEAVFISVGYGHFRICHVEQHHRFVGTHLDTASALRGESVYSFWLKSILGGWAFSWRKRKLRVMTGLLMTLGWLVFLGWRFGAQGLAMFFVVSTVSILMLETMNYVEHYGLRRELRTAVEPEAMQAGHSWDSDCWLTGKSLFHLQRHSHHHLSPRLHFADLELLPSSKSLPTGYGGMLLLALWPSLFRRVMHPRLDRSAEEKAGHVVR